MAVAVAALNAGLDVTTGVRATESGQRPPRACSPAISDIDVFCGRLLAAVGLREVVGRAGGRLHAPSRD